MNSFEIINLLCFAVCFLWAFYHAHVSDSTLKRFAYSILVASSMLVMISIILPSGTFFSNRYVSGQRLLFNFSFALYCLIDFYCEWNTERFKLAFTNSKTAENLTDTK